MYFKDLALFVFDFDGLHQGILCFLKITSCKRVELPYISIFEFFSYCMHKCRKKFPHNVRQADSFASKLPFKSSATNIRVELESQKSWNITLIQHWNWLNHRPFYLSGQDLYKLPIVSLGFPSLSMKWNAWYDTQACVHHIKRGNVCIWKERRLLCTTVPSMSLYIKGINVKLR